MVLRRSQTEPHERLNDVLRNAFTFSKHDPEIDAAAATIRTAVEAHGEDRSPIRSHCPPTVQMIALKDDDRSMEAILHRIRERYEEDSWDQFRAAARSRGRAPIIDPLRPLDPLPVGGRIRTNACRKRFPSYPGRPKRSGGRADIIRSTPTPSGGL
jgi:hypothetical protein